MCVCVCVCVCVCACVFVGGYKKMKFFIIKRINTRKEVIV